MPRLVLDKPIKHRLVLDEPRKLKLVEEKPLSGLAEKISPVISKIAKKGKKALLTPQRIVPSYLGGEKEKRETIKSFIAAKPERPYAVNIAGEVAKPFIDYASPEMIIAGGLTGGVAKAGIKKALATKTGLKIAEKHLPTLLKKSIAQVKEARLPKPKIEPPKPPDAISKVTQALKEAKPIRKEQELLYTIERRKRAGTITDIGKKVRGEKGFFAQKKALKGEFTKVEFEGLRGKIKQADIDDLFAIIEDNPNLQVFNKITAKEGLAKLLEGKGGKIPTEGEMKLLKEVFPEDFIRTILDKKPLLQKLFSTVEDVVNIPKALMASGELSGTLRQAFFLTTRHPIIAAKAFPKQVKYFFSEKAYQSLKKDIRSRPTYPLMHESELSLTDILTGKEEKFISRLSEKIPIIGKFLIRPSDRAFTGYLNKLRADVFDHLVKQNKIFGNPLELKGIAKVINHSTGRGDLPQMLEGSAKLINGIFFSPRLQFSRIALMNPSYYASLPPVARKEALQVLVSSISTVATTLGLAKASGADVGLNPFSADFLKVKIKGHPHTRYEITAGVQQYLRGAMQFIFGKHISSTTGVETRVGEGYKPLNRAGIAGRILETKEAPFTSFAMAILKGQGFGGRKLDIPKEVMMRVVPMIAQDTYDLYKEGGLKDLPMIIPAILGVGVQTYAPTPSEMVYSANSVLKAAKDLFQQGRLKKSKELMDRNKEIIEKGKALEPMQKIVNFFKTLNNKLEKSTLFTPEQIKEKIAINNAKIKQIEAEMETRTK